MVITATTLGIILTIAAMLVIGMLGYYVMRVGRRYDIICTWGLLAASIGLLQSARATDAPVDLFPAVGSGFALFSFALVIWWEGLRRFRNAG